MGTVERLIHDTTLPELANLYVIIKKNSLASTRNRQIGNCFPNPAPEIDLETYWQEIPTLCFVRSLMIQKLTNELYDDYHEIYGEDAKDYLSSALDYTTYDEYSLLKQRARELDLTDFFLIHNYIFHSKLTLDVEIEAEMEQTHERDKYISEIHYRAMMEALANNKPKIKKR